MRVKLVFAHREVGLMLIGDCPRAPGLTETALLPMAIESDGAQLGAVFAALVERAVARG